MFKLELPGSSGTNEQYYIETILPTLTPIPFFEKVTLGCFNQVAPF